MFKSLSFNVLYANLADNVGAEARKQILITTCFNLISAIVISIFAVNALTKDNHALLVVLALFLSVNIGNYFYLKYSANYKLSSYIVVISMTILSLYLLCTGGEHNSGALWCYITPILAFYVSGKRIGLVINCIFVATISYILFVSDSPIITNVYTHAFSFRFIVSLICVVLTAWVYEISREDSKNEILQINKKLEMTSKIDPLTGLPNRRGLLKKIQKRIKSKISGVDFCILMIDVDDFKNVNSQHTHSGGDHVLKEVGKTLYLCTNYCYDFARWGGEEFVVYLPDTSLSKATSVAEDLKNIVEDLNIYYRNELIKLTISVGVAKWNNEKNLNELFHNAGACLQIAKNNGKNTVVAQDN